MKYYAEVLFYEVKRVDIRSLRESAGLSVRQMANRLGIQNSHYSRIERGIIRMTRDKYEKFNDILSKAQKGT